MNRIFLVIVVLSNLIACKPISEKYLQNTLSVEETEAFKWDIIYYIGKTPVKFQRDSLILDSIFLPHYSSEVKQIDLVYHYKDKSNTEYFLVNRIAPSIKRKKTATGGKLRRDRDGKIVSYEEVFRTWKKTEEELKPIMDKLFVEMIEGKSLKQYEPENSGNLEIIEFPNSETYFDTSRRIWISTRESILDDYYDLKRDQLIEQLRKKREGKN